MSLLAWDPADWSVIRPLLDAGQTPSLARLARETVVGDLASPDLVVLLG